jgi:hypothetical protein
MPLCRANLHEISVPGGYCATCAHCLVCQKQMSAVELDWCYARAQKAGEEVIFEHPRCFSPADRESLANKTVEIPQHLFDKLNAARLLFEPSDDLSRSSNEKQAELFLTPWLVDMDYENLCLFLIRLESIASATMLAIGRSHKDIDLSLKERDKSKFAEAEKERQSHRTRESATPITDRKYKKITLTKEKKAIEKFVSMGFSQTDAESFVTEAIARGKERVGLK